MRAVWTIAAREMFAFFVSPVAYVVLTVWLIIHGTNYYLLTSFYAGQPAMSASMSPLSAFFGGSVLFFIPLLVFAPVLTMRLLAEERNLGTLEPLLTAPVSTAQVVFGKYLAAMVFWLALWLPTTMYVWITSQFGSVDLGAMAASYTGVIGIGLYYMAIGLAMSALSKNQISAALLTFLVLGGLFSAGLFTFTSPSEQWETVLSYLSLWEQMQSFAKGVVDTRYVVFDVSLAAFFLFVAWRVLEGRRWQ